LAAPHVSERCKPKRAADAQAYTVADLPAARPPKWRCCGAFLAPAASSTR
jgi:hypothetical protein